MATPIDQLNFKVILNDTDFKTRINEDITLAGRLNTSLSKVIQIKTRQIVSSAGVKNAQQMSQYLTEISNKIRTMPKGQFLIGDADRLNATLAETNKRLDQIISKSQKAGQGMGVTGNNLTRTWMRFSSTIWSVVGTIRLVTSTLGSAIKNISNFQQANANLATIMQVSRKEIETLTNDALMLGRTTEWTASQVTELQTALAKLGYDMPQIRNMQASVLQFATAVGAKLPDAANLAGASLRMFGMHSTEMQKALEILAASTNKTALDFEKLKVSLPYVGAIAHSIGFDIAQTASLLGVLTNAGLESSRAGTGLRQVLLELSKTNGKLQTAMGGNVKSFDDFVNGLQAMRDRGLQAGEATKLVSTRASSALLILANGVDTIKKLNNEVRDTDGLLKDIQQERLDTLHGSTLLLKSAWEGLIQTFRDSAGPMKDIVDWLTKIVRWMSLAESRANRIAQGTKNGFWGGWAARPGLWAKGVTGSDELTKTYEDMFDRLIEQGHTVEEATRQVNEQMRQRERDLRKEFGLKEGEETKNLEESWWFRRLSKNAATGFFTNLFTQGTQAKSEQMEAMSNTFDAVGDYMETRSKEDAEIAANAWLEEWKAVFDAEGEDAARAAMSKVGGSELIDKMKQQMEAYIANGGAAGAQERGKGKTKKEIDQEIINGLKNEATYLRKLYDDYMKLVPLLGEEGAAKKMAEILDGGDYSKESLEQGILDITDALKKMGKEGEDAAESILRSWGLDEFSRVYKQLQDDKKAADKAQKAIEKYESALEKWKAKAKEYSGVGFEYDATKIIEDYKARLEEINAEYRKNVELAKEAGRATDAFDEGLQKQINSAKATAQDKLNGLANSYMKDALSARGIDLSNLSDKSLRQLREMKTTIQEIADSVLEIDSADLSSLEQFGIDINNLSEDDMDVIEFLRKEGILLDENTVATLKLRMASQKLDLSFDGLKAAIKDLLENGLERMSSESKEKIAKAVKYFAKEIINLSDSFIELGEAIDNPRIQNAGETLKELGDLASGVAQGFSQAGPLGAAISLLLWSAKGIISDLANDAKEASEAIDMMNEAQRRYNQELDKTAIKSQSTVFGKNTLGELREYMSLVKKYRSYIDNYWKSESEEGNKETRQLLQAYGFLDSDGNIIIDKIKAAIESGIIGGETAKDLEDAINTYKEAVDGINDIAESLVGSVVSDVADKLVDSWWKAGDAALDYADILGDVAKAYAKLIVQNMLLETAFDTDKQEAFKKALKDGDVGEAMSIVEGAMQAAVDMLPAVNEALQVLEPYRLMTSDSSESNSVGPGLKSMTEETASLIASYFNAVRADVSVIRGTQEKWSNTIESLGSSIPTLNDYMNQVAANTYDTAQNTQSILSELQSVIGSPGTSGMVVRVEYA